MGELGAKLRGERERRGIGIDEIESETRIRAKFLLAIEEERFDLLPGPAYVRAFVRDYAEQLGLDPQELVNELNARPELVPDEVVMVPPRQVAKVPLLDRRARIVVWIAAAVALVVVAAVAVAVALLAARGSSAGGAPAPPPAGKTGTGPGNATTTPATSGPASVTTPTTPPPAGPRPLVLAASGGSVWLSVRAGSATGKLLFNSTLAQGRRLRFARKRLWVRVGAPWNLTMSAAGRHLTIPLQTTGNMLVTPAGARITA
jgi:Helix-turn-helix domain